MSSNIVVCLLVILLGTCGLVDAVGLNDSCVTQNGCYCQTTSNEFIDLSPIGNFRFNETDSKGTYQYEFQLCQTFTIGNCSSVYGCEFADIANQYIDIASSPPEFVNIHTIRYTTSTNRTTLINVFCSVNDSLTLTDSTDSSITKFNLTTKHACPQALTSTVSPQTTNTTVTTATTTDHSNTTASNTTAYSNSTTTVTSPTTTAASNTTSSPTSPAHNTTTAVVTTTHVASTTHSGEAMSQRPINFGFTMAFIWLVHRLLSWR